MLLQSKVAEVFKSFAGKEVPVIESHYGVYNTDRVDSRDALVKTMNDAARKLGVELSFEVRGAIDDKPLNERTLEVNVKKENDGKYHIAHQCHLGCEQVYI